jgi:hypothetical protein
MKMKPHQESGITDIGQFAFPTQCICSIKVKLIEKVQITEVSATSKKFWKSQEMAPFDRNFPHFPDTEDSN